MIYLLDTHVLLCSLMDTAKLSDKVREIIENQENRIAVSVISLWEISLKFSLNKLPLEGVSPEDFPKLIEDIGFELISLRTEEVSTYHDLNANWHRDPFDKMLIWQAIQKNIIFVSSFYGGMHPHFFHINLD